MNDHTGNHHTGNRHADDDSPGDDSPVDGAAGIRAPLESLYARMCRAWTDGDAAAYGACFTPDCDYVSFDGTRVHGREAVVAAHDTLFGGVLSGSALVGAVTAVRPLGDDVALVHGAGSVVVAWRAHPPKRRLTANSLVAVRTPEGWLFTAIHNGRIRPLAVPEPDAVPSRIGRALDRAARAARIGRYRRAA